MSSTAGCWTWLERLSRCIHILESRRLKVSMRVPHPTAGGAENASSIVCFHVSQRYESSPLSEDCPNCVVKVTDMCNDRGGGSKRSAKSDLNEIK